MFQGDHSTAKLTVFGLKLSQIFFDLKALAMNYDQLRAQVCSVFLTKPEILLALIMELAIATISSLLLHGILVDFSNELNQTSNQLLTESQYLLTKNTGIDTGEKRLPNEFRDFSQAIIMF